jgi:hypothetical protein
VSTVNISSQFMAGVLWSGRSGRWRAERVRTWSRERTALGHAYRERIPVLLDVV